MKKAIFAPIILLACFAACRKNDTLPGTKYSISAYMDGVPVSFSTQISVDTSHPGTIAISAFRDATTFSPYITITLKGNTPFAKGDYPYTVVNGNSSVLAYNDWNSHIQPFSSTDNIVTITAMDKATLSGTFQATTNYYMLDQTTWQYVLDSTRVLTNGKFYLQLGQD